MLFRIISSSLLSLSLRLINNCNCLAQSRDCSGWYHSASRMQPYRPRTVSIGYEQVMASRSYLIVRTLTPNISARSPTWVQRLSSNCCLIASLRSSWFNAHTSFRCSLIQLSRVKVQGRCTFKKKADGIVLQAHLTPAKAIPSWSMIHDSVSNHIVHLSQALGNSVYIGGFGAKNKPTIYSYPS